MTGVGTLAWLVTRVIANPDIAASDDSNHYFDWDTDWRHVVFWVANLGVAPLWILGVVAPRSSLTHGIWTSPFVALPWTLAFSVGLIVSSCLPWWLNLWLDGQLSLPHLIHQLGSDPGSMLLIWLYILGFDVAVFAGIYKKAYDCNCAGIEISCWTLLTALCAPLGHAAFTLRQCTLAATPAITRGKKEK